MVTSGPLAGPPSKARPGKVLGACGGGAPAPQRCLTLHPHHRAPVSGGGRRDCAPPVAPSGPRREPAVDSAVASTPCLVGLGQAPSNRTAGQPPGNGPEIRTGPGHRHRHLLPRRAPRPRQMMAPPEPRRGSIQRLAALPGSVCARRSGVHRSEGRDARDLTAGPDPSSAGRRGWVAVRAAGGDGGCRRDADPAGRRGDHQSHRVPGDARRCWAVDGGYRAAAGAVRVGAPAPVR